MILNYGLSGRLTPATGCKSPTDMLPWAWPGEAWRGSARPGRAWQGKARRGEETRCGQAGTFEPFRRV